MRVNWMSFALAGVLMLVGLAAVGGEDKKETKEQPPLDVPEPTYLNRDQWKKGAGSSCYWESGGNPKPENHLEGDRLHLEEGDEYLDRILKGDFAATVAIEAQMDHRSMIRIELRPLKDSGARTKITGWGSKEGSPPMLQVNKDIKARGDEQPRKKQINLSFVRTDTKIEFFCDGKSIGHAFDEKPGQAYYLWVCGKGIMNGAKIRERD